MPFPYEVDWYKPGMTIPDMLKHGGVAQQAPTLTQLQTGEATDGTPGGPDPIVTSITSPGGRPEVQLRGINFVLPVLTTPTPITGNRLSVDTIIVDVPSSAANSVFFGYGGGVSTASGLEVRPGIPLIWQPDNGREAWELQRQLEYIALLIGATQLVPNLPTYRAPRVVVDPSQYYCVAAVNTNVAIMLVYIPEQQ
jgi:hypothetical protein